jgi:hypothetical protein
MHGVDHNTVDGVGVVTQIGVGRDFDEHFIVNEIYESIACSPWPPECQLGTVDIADIERLDTSPGETYAGYFALKVASEQRQEKTRH